MAARRKATAKKSGGNAQKGLVPIGSANLPAEWREEMKRYVTDDQAVAAGGGGWPFISTRGGVLTYLDNPFEELDVIILGARRTNLFYEGDFDPDEPRGPTCFAIAKKEEDLAPPGELETKQHDACKGCWANAFGSSEKSKRGKACKNVVRLALLPADRLNAGVLGELEGARLSVPVTSVKNFGNYAAKISSGLELPLFAVVTRIGAEPHPKNQYQLTFEPVGAITDQEVLTTLARRRQEADTYLDQWPMLNDDADDAPAPPAKGGGRKRAKQVAAPAKKGGGRKRTSRPASGGAKY